MEDLPASKLRQHNACDCVMCEPCLDRTVEHSQQEGTNSAGSSSGRMIKCPGCRQDVAVDTEFVTLDMIGITKPKLKTLALPLVFRTIAFKSTSDSGPSGIYKKQDIELFGHPRLVSVPNQVTGTQLATLLESHIPEGLSQVSYKVDLVNGQGKYCSRCLYSAQCFDCVSVDPANAETTVVLQPTDTLAVTYANLASDVIASADSTDVHPSVFQVPKLPDQLDLEDCLKAFSETETLDEANPWYCPACKKHQCASKTLSVWRFPDFLILYLKRFVFISNAAGALKLDMDVRFKVNDLDLTPYLSGPLRHGGGGEEGGAPVFNLYGCVCHFGSVYGGHYTAFSKHLASGQWNYFDDCSVNNLKVPGDSRDDHSSAYILFYQRSGSRHDSSAQLSLSEKCQAFCADSSGTINSQAAPSVQPAANKSLFPADEEDNMSLAEDLSHIIRSLDTPPPSS